MAKKTAKTDDTHTDTDTDATDTTSHNNEGTSSTMSNTTDTVAAGETVKVAGLFFAMPAPVYAAGHVLTDVEARVLNQTRVENLRNNSAAAVRKAMEAHGVASAEQLPAELIAELEQQFHAYAQTYTFNRQGSSRRVVDPVMAEAQKIAKQMLTAALRQRNVDTKTLPENWFAEQIGKLLDKKPDIMDEARRRIQMTKSTGDALLSDLGLE